MLDPLGLLQMHTYILYAIVILFNEYQFFSRTFQCSCFPAFGGGRGEKKKNIYWGTPPNPCQEDFVPLDPLK